MNAAKSVFVLMIMIFVMPVYLSAQYTVEEDLAWPQLKLDVPLFDIPYQVNAADTVGHGFFSSYANPSMGQSLAVTAGMLSSFHFGMQYFYDHSTISEPWKGIVYYAGLPLGDWLLMYIPGGDGWLHEEFHRAVMSRHGINSFNGMNLFPLGAETVSVSKIKDEDLIRLKEKSPADLVRLHAAGIEGEYLVIDKLQRNNFFYDQKIPNDIVYWLYTINAHVYIYSSSSSEYVDVMTQKMNEQETTVSSRDFTGFDMTAWVYDLFRPDEPYSDRGIHPSGEGIDRYRTTKNLTDEELNYLQRQTSLHFVNYLSPMLFLQKSIRLGNGGLAGNFAMRHLLTSFGSVVSAQVFLKYEFFNMAFAYHSYLNYDHYFPAIEAELVDYPLSVGKILVFLSPRIIIGTQPEDQKFKTGKHEFLGLFGLRADFMMTKHFFPYMDLTAKTDGWVAGNEYLDGNVSVKIGLSMRF